jgi:DNA-directed RNA polymerase subunit N (RpoN/RPB10)
MSCGRPLSGLWEKYKQESKNKNPKEVLDKLGIQSPCCRSLFLTNQDLIDEVADFRI